MLNCQNCPLKKCVSVRDFVSKLSEKQFISNLFVTNLNDICNFVSKIPEKQLGIKFVCYQLK